MNRKRGNRRRDRRTRPFRDIELDLTIEEVMADLDAGWLPHILQQRESGGTARRAA